MRKLFIFAGVILILGGCAAAPSQPAAPVLTNTAPAVTWKTYSNPQLGFSVFVPEQVIINSSLVPLNIYEEKNAVYFSGQSLEDALVSRAYEMKIMGTTVKNESEILPFIESAYGVKGCKVGLSDIPENLELKFVNVSAKKENLMPDDPEACFFAGKLSVLYRPTDGKVLTSQSVGQTFLLPDGYAGERVNVSLKFLPAAATGDSVAGQCVCPDGYIKEGEACTPKCYFSTPPCLMPSTHCQNNN